MSRVPPGNGGSKHAGESPDPGRQDPWHQEIDTQEIRIAIDKSEFGVLYQPKVDTSTLEFVAVEALIRWNHPQRGLIRPGQFVKLAERRGLIAGLTDHIVETTFAQWSDWHKAGLQLRLSVNVSAATLDDHELPDRILSYADQHNVSPESIVLEVTESWLSRDRKLSRDILIRLREQGFSLSIDDFGTGYSSLRQLKEFPFTEIKLDKSFLQNAMRNEQARDVFETCVGLGQRLGLHVIAEGIETQADWDFVCALGVDEGQGFFIARPMRGGHIPQWLSHWNATLGAHKSTRNTESQSLKTPDTGAT